MCGKGTWPRPGWRPSGCLAHAAISGVLGQAPLPDELYCYRIENLSGFHRHNLDLHVSWGRVRLTHVRLGEVHDLAYAALNSGGHEFTAFVSPPRKGQDLAALGG